MRAGPLLRGHLDDDTDAYSAGTERETPNLTAENVPSALAETF
jgi:hypothetical protein